MRRLYTLLLLLALPFASAVVLWRGWRERGYWQGWSARFGAGPALPGAAHSIWLHAVSVGEVQAAAALVAALRAQWPAVPLVVTAATPAGCARARAAFGPEVEVRYAPYDLPVCVRGALRRLRPRLLLIMETEIWPNLLDGCARGGVPVLFVSARLSVRSAARLRPVAGALQPALHSVVAVAAQTATDAGRFTALGVAAERVSVGGNLKFDRTPSDELYATGRALRNCYAAQRPLWVAGSTHAGEEVAALAAHAALRAVQPQALLVLAPRHRPRFEDVAQLLDRSGLKWIRRSAAATADDAAVLLLDTIGELEAFYAGADLAFVGGSLAPIGGHNLLEPAALGVATLAGPQQDNAPDVARLLDAAGALRVVRDAGELGAALIALYGDRAARQRMGEAGQAVVAANRGALARVLQLVRERVTPPDPAAAAAVPPASR